MEASHLGVVGQTRNNEDDDGGKLESFHGVGLGVTSVEIETQGRATGRVALDRTTARPN